MKKYFVALIVCALVSAGPDAVHGDDTGSALIKTLPPPSFGIGWVTEGRPAVYTKENLYERINGESELFFPYGFELLASARYVRKDNPDVSIEADVYRMSSLINAFGIYSYYRRKDDAAVKIGTEGVLSLPQLIFYQDRFFIRLQSAGLSDKEIPLLSACAASISKNLPAGKGRPAELGPFRIQSVVPNSERYIARSLLGYEFFSRGIIADASADNEKMQIFLITEDSHKAAGMVLDKYRSYLKESGKDGKTTGINKDIYMEVVDPLYGNTIITLYGRYIIGAVRAKDISIAKRIVEELRQGLASR